MAADFSGEPRERVANCQGGEHLIMVLVRATGFDDSTLTDLTLVGRALRYSSHRNGGGAAMLNSWTLVALKK